MHPQSIEDAVAIYHTLTEQSPAAARRFWENLHATLDLQASISTPGSPWISENKRSTDLRWTRVKGFKNYLIFFRVNSTTIEVTRILHGARDLENLLP
jgi:toxin ParE1/3/4